MEKVILAPIHRRHAGGRGGAEPKESPRAAFGARLPHPAGGTAVGGGALSDVTCQILSDCTGKIVETVESPQNIGAVGAAVLVAVGLGFIKNIEASKELIPAVKRFVPNKETKAAYDKNFTVYKTLYKNNKEAFAALNAQ